MLPDNCLGRVQISKVSQVNILLIQHSARYTSWLGAPCCSVALNLLGIQCEGTGTLSFVQRGRVCDSADLLLDFL